MRAQEALVAVIVLSVLLLAAGAARAEEAAQPPARLAADTEGSAGNEAAASEANNHAQGDGAAASDVGDARPSPSAGPSPQPSPAQQAPTDAKANATGYLPYDEPGLPPSPGLATVAGRVLGSLAVVLGLIVVTAFGLKRYLGGTKAPTTSRKVSELVEVTPLGGKRYLYLIRVADRLLVVGAGGDRLSLLSEIKDPEVLERVASLPRRSEFLELFHRVRAGVGKHGQRPEQAVAS